MVQSSAAWVRDSAPGARQSKGFIAHASGLIPGGFRAVEIWQSQEDWQRWFDTTVRSTREAGALPDSEKQFFEAPFVFVA